MIQGKIKSDNSSNMWNYREYSFGGEIVFIFKKSDILLYNFKV